MRKKEESVLDHPITPNEGERRIRVHHWCPVPPGLNMDHTLGLKKDTHVYEVIALPHLQSLHN